MTFNWPTKTNGIRVLFPFALALSANTGFAQTNDRESITALISDRCAGCHIAPYHDDDTGINAPSFREIKADPDTYTAERLREFLADPHWPMSQFILSSKDIDRIIVYLTTYAPAQ